VLIIGVGAHPVRAIRHISQRSMLPKTSHEFEDGFLRVKDQINPAYNPNSKVSHLR